MVQVQIQDGSGAAHRVTGMERPQARARSRSHEARIAAARAPALAALGRIEPLMPPRKERARLGVGGIVERERALLTDDEVEMLRTSAAETLRLAEELRSRALDAAKPLCDAEQA